MLLALAAAAGCDADATSPAAPGSGPHANDELCGERPGGQIDGEHVLRFESAQGDLVVQIRREFEGYFGGESSQYRLESMALRLGDATHCITQAESLRYENTHHNWSDAAFGSAEGNRYEVRFGDSRPKLLGYGADGSSVLPETELIMTGGPILCFSCVGIGSSFPLIWLVEIMVHETPALTDEAGEQEPWIELENAYDQDIELQGWTLSDDFAHRRKWPFPSTVLPALTKLVLFADGQPEQGALHTSFRLSAEGGQLVLTAPDGTTDGGFVYAAPPEGKSLAYDFEARSYVESAPSPGQ